VNKILPRNSVVILVLSLFFPLSCGLEDVLFLDYIPDINVTMTDNTSARIDLPPGSAEGYSAYFTNFAIYYRIYISGERFTGLINTETVRKQINASLDSDFKGLYYLTDKTSTSVNPSNLETTFTNRRYFKLNLEEANINTILGGGSLGQTLEIQFPQNPGVRPVLTLNGGDYTLLRAVEGPSLVFSPRPSDRYYLNHPELFDIANVKDSINADVATNSQTASDELRFTYVSMYIFAIGREYLSTVYSQPTHIGVFRLPDALF
jgi:hypothetical protein